MASLLELIQNAVTPEITRRIGGLVGESPDATDLTMRRAAPAVLAGVMNTASTINGAERIQSMITEGGWGSDLVTGLASRLAGGGGTSALLKSGEGLISGLFGGNKDKIAEVIANESGVQRGSASTIMSLAAPIVMSVIGRQISARGLSPAGLSSMLLGERTSLLAALPAGLGGLLGLRDTAATVTKIPETVMGAEPMASPIARWWPAVLVGLAAIALLFLFARGRHPELASTPIEPAASPRQTTSITLPGGARINVDQGGSVNLLSDYLAGSATDVPKRFVFDDLKFETGSTQLTENGERTVDSLVAVLKSYPSVKVSLEGHTDTTGDAAANKTLSEQRADTVKRMLVEGGVAPDRVQAAGYGQERPVADNNTEAGRAKNRRLELVVLQR
jgi:OmpA-OmpF porin, OOP family